MKDFEEDIELRSIPVRTTIKSEDLLRFCSIAHNVKHLIR